MNKPTPDELRRMYIDERLTSGEIAERCQCSISAAKKWLHDYGIPTRPPGSCLANRGLPEPTIDDLRRMLYVERMSYRQIAEVYGVDHSAVFYWVKHRGLPSPSAWSTPQRDYNPEPPPPAEIEALINQGVSSRVIAEAYGVSPGTIQKFCRRHGIKMRRDGWDGGKRLVCNDGHLVRSTYEWRVDNWLHDHGVPHVYEPVLPPNPRYHADFYANGWYIEIWGVRDLETYSRRRRFKCDLYRLHALPLIEMTYDSFATAHRDRLERQLSRCLTAPLLAL